MEQEQELESVVFVAVVALALLSADVQKHRQQVQQMLSLQSYLQEEVY